MGTDTKKKKHRTFEQDSTENLVLKVKSIPVRRRGRPRGNHIPFNPAEKRVRNAHLESIRRRSVCSAYNNLRCAMGIQRTIPRHTTVRVAVEMVRSFTRKEIILKILKKRQKALRQKVVQLLKEQESGWKIETESDKEGIDTNIDDMMKAEAEFSSRIYWINNIDCIVRSKSSRTDSTCSTEDSSKVCWTLQHQNAEKTNSSVDNIHPDDIFPTEIDSLKTNMKLTDSRNYITEVTVKSEPLDEPATIEMKVEPFEPSDWELFSSGLSSNHRATTATTESNELNVNSCKHMDDVAADWVPSYAQKAKDWVPSYKHYFARKLAKLKKAKRQEFDQSSPEKSLQDEEIDQVPMGQELALLLEIDEDSSKEEVADWCVPSQVSPNVLHALRDHNYQRSCHEPTAKLPPTHTHDILPQSPS